MTSDPVSRRRVRDYMTSHVAAIRETTTLERVAKAFKDLPFRHLPVRDETGKSVIGMISERDLFLAAVAGRYDPAHATREFMSKHLVVVSPDASLATAAARMHEAHIGSVLVQGEGGAFLGILTLHDLARALAEEAELEPS